MNIETYRSYCLSKPYVTEDFPFDEKILVFRVGGKIFSLIDVLLWDFINLKCDPERAIELREQFESITPGYHMNKKHWNSIRIDSSISDKLILELTDHSYELCYNSLTKKQKESLI